MPRANDAVVIGSGPNGLAAAIVLVGAGHSVTLLEAKDTIGGGARSQLLTLPGFLHDVCSAIHPLGVASPFMRSIPLGNYGLEWLDPPAAFAHPFDDGTAVLVRRSIGDTADQLGGDGAAYKRLMTPLVRDWQQVLPQILGPFPLPLQHLPALLRFAAVAIRSASGLLTDVFRGPRARAIFAGMAAHAILPLDRPATAAFGLVLGILAHAVGWPLPRGGSQRIADAMGAYLESLGGHIVTGWPVTNLRDIPDTRAALFDITPRQLVRIASDRLPAWYVGQLSRYRYGPGVFKLDLALDAPVPWRSDECSRAATVHLGGSFEEIAAAESEVWHGVHPERPFVLLAQQSLFDPTRAPRGCHTLWTYCHVPHASTLDMTARIEEQIERFAPGFKTHVLARATRTATQMEAYNENYVGGDINGGVQDLRQLFTRPTLRLDPYTTPAKGIYLCSSSTPPGGGVHGMCGYHAAKSAMRYMRGTL